MKRFAVLGLLLAAVAMMVVACAPPAAPTQVVTQIVEKQVEVEKSAEGTPVPEEAAVQGEAAVQEEADEYDLVGNRHECSVPRQLILYGTPDGIDCLFAKGGLPGFEREPYEQIVLQDPDMRSCPWRLALNEFKSETSVVLRLYKGTNESRIEDIIGLAQKTAISNGCQAIPEPNYLISDPATPLRGKPWIPVGSPDQGAPAEAQANRFESQPAFAAIGLSGPATSGGKGVRVGIFDTVPKSFGVTPGISQDFMFPPTPAPYQVNMKVTGLMPSATIVPTLTWAGDHGLFVAGLVKAVAPEAKLELYEVLDEGGTGDLFTLMGAIKTFVCAKPDSDAILPAPAVINLSLGLHWYDEGHLFSLKPEDLGQWLSGLDSSQIPGGLSDGFAANGHPLSGRPKVTVIEEGKRWRIKDAGTQYSVQRRDEELMVFRNAIRGRRPTTCLLSDPEYAKIKSLEDLLDAANKLGVVIVAAAGNSANNAIGKVEAADIPAFWDNTIGVAASKPGAPGIACFSNTGDVLAPGGEGLKTPSNTECKPQFKTCDPAGECAYYGLVSLGTKSTTNYLYWAGTSFATPLVSGLVARCIQEAADASPAWSGADVPANVWKAIQAGAASHGGVIHVGDTLANCK